MIYGNIVLVAYSSYAKPLSPPPASIFIATESGITLATEDSNLLVTEG